MQQTRRQAGRWCVLVLLLLDAVGVAATLDEQRAAFRDVYPAAERGQWAPVADKAGLLEDYVLWPDLEAAYLRTQIGKDDAAVRRFLDRYGTLKPARELRYRYALHLAEAPRHREFLDLYDRYYRQLNEASLDCLALQADIRLGQLGDVPARAGQLWLIGKNQVDQCDPVFSYMRGAGLLTPDLLSKRYALAVAEREFMLARYVARSIDDEHLATANRWLRAQGNPENFLEKADTSADSAAYREQLAYAARRLAYRDPVESLGHWTRLGRVFDFDARLDREVRRHAAISAARLNHADARQMLEQLAPAAIDNEVRRWQIRAALRDGDWARVIAVIDTLAGRERQREEWRYWRGVALHGADDEANAMLALSSLARTRSYYGFLAADQLGVDYALSESPVGADETVLARLASRPELLRARELLLVGLDGRARSEWDAAVRPLSDAEKAQAAILAHRWEWHSRAIAAAAQVGQFDDLALRYPLPHRDFFRRSSAEAGVQESWAYGIARSESLFMRDIRSSAGAVGVMQLMPSTGRRTAEEIRHPYEGRNTLIDPASNIRLGTTYLGKMHTRFDHHPALATAAYNAGPQRVLRWLPAAGPIDARIWIETIPFNETRSYVRRVLASDVIFHWRLTGQTSRLSDRLPEIIPAAAKSQVAGQ